MGHGSPDGSRQEKQRDKSKPALTDFGGARGEEREAVGGRLLRGDAERPLAPQPAAERRGGASDPCHEIVGRYRKVKCKLMGAYFNRGENLVKATKNQLKTTKSH